MAAISVTFIGGADTGNVGSTTMGTPQTGQIDFPLNKPVILDAGQAVNQPQKDFLEHLIGKLRAHPHFKVEDVKGDAKEPVTMPKTEGKGRKKD